MGFNTFETAMDIVPPGAILLPEGTSASQEDNTPDPRLSGALAAVETAKTAASSIDQSVSPNQEQSTKPASNGITAKRTDKKSFNISTFRSEVVGSDGILPTHSFLVRFAPMSWMTASAIRNGVDEMLTMRCDNVVLPSVNLLQEQNVRRYGFGPVENVAYGVNVGDLTLQFIVDRGAGVVDFFEAWMNKIVNRDSYGGANMNTNVGDNRTPYEVAYKDTYSCPSVNVFIYDRAQNTVMEYNIYDVFPTGIQSMNMSWSEENAMMKLNVTFAFTDFRIRPKVSFFGQSATQAPSSPIDPTIMKFIEAGNKPLVDASRIVASADQALADLSKLPVVIGDGPDGSPRTFGTPADTAPTPSNTPEVTPPTSRDPFGQPFTSA